MPDWWTFMEPGWARPWAKCWKHHQCMDIALILAEATVQAYSPLQKKGGSGGLGEPRERALYSVFRIRNDVQEETTSRLGPEALATIWQEQRQRKRIPVRGMACPEPSSPTQEW